MKTLEDLALVDLVLNGIDKLVRKVPGVSDVINEITKAINNAVDLPSVPSKLFDIINAMVFSCGTLLIHICVCCASH